MLLKLRVGDPELVVVYGPAEGEKVTHVRDTPEEWKIKKGDHVKAFGKYIKDNGEMIEVYSSDSYYIHVLAERTAVALPHHHLGSQPVVHQILRAGLSLKSKRLGYARISYRHTSDQINHDGN